MLGHACRSYHVFGAIYEGLRLSRDAFVLLKSDSSLQNAEDFMWYEADVNRRVCKIGVRRFNLSVGAVHVLILSD